MKKLTVCMLVMIMAASAMLSACDSKAKSETSSSESGTVSSSAVAEDSTSTAEEGSAAETDDLNAFYEEMIEGLKPTMDSMKTDTMDIDVYVRDGSLVMSYKMLDVEGSEELTAAMEEQMANQDSVFQATVDQISHDEASLVVEYLDKDGEVIYSKEYKHQ